MVLTRCCCLHFVIDPTLDVLRHLAVSVGRSLPPLLLTGCFVEEHDPGQDDLVLTFGPPVLSVHENIGSGRDRWVSNILLLLYSALTKSLGRVLAHAQLNLINLVGRKRLLNVPLLIIRQNTVLILKLLNAHWRDA